MAKTRKNALIYMVVALALACMGVFFVGCGTDYSKISLSSSEQVVELEVGEEKELTFTIENYTSDFSNKVSVNALSSGLNSIFSASKVTYISSSKFSVTITALAGGTGMLNIKTLEGGKECNVEISVTQYSSSFKFNGDTLYASNSTSFSASVDMFTYTANTTVEDVRFYYMTSSVSKNYSISAITAYGDDLYATFTDGTSGGQTDKQIYEFDNLSLDENNNVLLTCGGEEVLTAFSASEVNILAVYVPSLPDEYENVSYDNILFDTSVVYILPDLEAEISGGYLVSDTSTTTLLLSELEDEIIIVPNKTEMSEYIVRIEIVSVNQDTEIVTKISSLASDENADSVIVDYISASDVADYETYARTTTYTAGEIYYSLGAEGSYTSAGVAGTSLSQDDIENGNYYIKTTLGALDDGKSVRYVKISQNSQVQATTERTFSVYYKLAENISDQSVNITETSEIRTKIAPTGLAVNSSTDIQSLTLYYHYTAPSFGWHDLDFSVLSGYETSPDYDGIWFEFKDITEEAGTTYQYIDGVLCWGTTPISDLQSASNLDMEYGTTTLKTGSGNLYSDLSVTFKVRGADTGEKYLKKTLIVVHVESEDLTTGDDVITVITCEVRPGANALRFSNSYSADNGVTANPFYFDVSAGTINFDGIVYADDLFQTVTISLQSGTSVASFALNSAVYFYDADGTTYGKEGYYLSFDITPTATGMGVYKIVLDNGTSTTFTIYCINTLSTDTTSIKLSSTGNDAVSTSYFDELKEENSGASNALEEGLYIEILNPSANEEITYFQSASMEISANYETITLTNNSLIVSCSITDNVVKVTTQSNGDATICATIKGYVVESFARKDTSVLVYIYVSSYSLLDTYYLKNGDNYALSNTIYYGGTSDKTVTLTPYAENSSSTNFYQYKFTDSLLAELYAVDGTNNEYYYTIGTDNYSTSITQELVHEEFDKKFIFFYGLNASGNSWGSSSVSVTVRKTVDGGSTEKTITLSISTGLIFYVDVGSEGNYNYIYKEYDDDDILVATYTLISCTNVFQIANQGTLDLSSLTYTHSAWGSETEMVISSYISQRGQQKRYDAHIYVKEYVSVETISLLSSLEEISFTNESLTAQVTVSIYPTDATNNSIQVEFVTTNGNTYSDMVSYSMKTSGTGTYIVTLSCEAFYNQHKSDIQSIETSLTGTIYIYPSDWGSSYSSIGLNTPVAISIQYRNGSEANPYLLEDVEDVLAIGTNESTLKSHYVISTTIDMSSVEAALPIGILLEEGEYKLVGFSGSIKGTTSYATISGISLNRFTCEIDGVVYSGLFAEIAEGGKIENVSFSGCAGSSSSPFVVASTTISGIFTAVNLGTLTNVGVTVTESYVEVADSVIFYFGAVAGINAGDVLQDFRYYDGSIYYIYDSDIGAYVESTSGTYLLKNEDEEDENKKEYISTRNYYGQSAKNLAYYSGDFTITSSSGNLIIGGIVGANSGNVVRTLATSDEYKLYGTNAYSAYVNIIVKGTLGSYTYVGGAVGLASPYSAAMNSSLFQGVATSQQISDSSTSSVVVEANIENMLVGGEISTLSATCGDAAIDGVGGIVGLAQSNEGSTTLYIISNTSRVFVRGHLYVGGIVGIDYFSSDGNIGGSNTQYGTENIIQAVDDGRGSVLSANIIKENEAIETGATISDYNVYYAIGNAYTSISTTITSQMRSYTNYTFAAYSYLSRTEIAWDENTEVTLEQTSTSTYYGDVLVLSASEGSKYNITASYKYVTKTAEIGVSDNNNSALTSKIGTAEENPLVFILPYFSVSSDVSGALGNNAQDEISALNTHTTNSSLYPFKLDNPEVSISASSSDVLSVDTNGKITVNSTGLATITLSSILNQNQSIVIYIYVVNFFDRTISASIFYDTASTSGTNITDGYTSVIYGNSYNKIYVVPTYYYQSSEKDEQTFSITSAGVLSYKNVAYYLSKNTDITIDLTDTTQGYAQISSSQVDKQYVMFYKQVADESLTDTYSLMPILAITIDKTTYYYALSGSKIDISVIYKDTATSISTISKSHSMQTNGYFTETIYINSTNEEEVLFYQITDEKGNIVQSRLPRTVGSYSTVYEYSGGVVSSTIDLGKNDYDYYISYTGTETSLFDITIKRTGQTNTFDFTCSINTNSKAYQNRYSTSIFGKYTFTFYSSELTSDRAATASFTLQLDEATLQYISLNNYSNYNDTSKPDNVVVPTQRGMIEVTLDPIDAVFDTLYISSADINTSSSVFALVYQTETSEGGVQYVLSETFGTYNSDGEYYFTYSDLMDFLDSDENAVSYRGRIYISYIMSANNIEDGVTVGYEVRVTNASGDVAYEASIEMQTKLSSYAKLVFDDKEAIGDYYFVARGLSYSLTLDAYGFSEDSVEITSSSTYATISGSNGKYTLQITSGSITYTDASAPGFYATITTRAEKEVDGVKVSTQDVLELYIMEYVLQYEYFEGYNEDIVDQMQNGVITLAVGNPLSLSLDITDFLEYSSTNSSVVSAVNRFVSSMTSSVTWTVYESGTATTLASGKSFSSAGGYYQISSLTVTPMKIYDPDYGVYYFSVQGYYTMSAGSYAFSSTSQGADILYTEFSLDVHNQSTQDSPIPIETYEELVNMKAGEWYILTSDIYLPSDQYATATGGETFTPISTKIAGLDGNAYTIYFGDDYGGSYTFSGLTEVGVFSSVDSNTILQNITVKLYTDCVFYMNQSTFTVGLLAATNSGIVTNCASESGETTSYKRALTVECSVTTSSSYVGGLIGSNSGTITNSRSTMNIYSTDNLAGFVGTNSGHIASSYFRGGTLTNDSRTTTEFTAGFVVSNTGTIYASYVSGDDTSNSSSAYYQGNETNHDEINANGYLSGFVFTNVGSVYDCYSNILLTQSGYFASGFVFNNTGLVERCFSTSVLGNNDNSNYGFVRFNEPEEDDDGIYSCYYLSDTDNEINVDISTPTEDEAPAASTKVTALSLDEFDDIDTFADYAIVSGRKTNSVWFFESELTSLDNFGGQIFNVGRPELVAANIVAQSRRDLDHTEEVTDENGATYVKYVYTYSSSYYALGTVYNPIVISDAEEFETYILQENNSQNYNYSYYRLIADIDYSDYLYNSGTYVTKFMGYLEGNFLTIKGNSLLSSDSLDSAGLFAEVGSSTLSKAIGTVMNFTYSPNEVDFANASLVGALVGKLDGGTLVNITLSGQGTVIGNNVVGGIVGAAVGNYTIFDVYSTYSAKARNQNVSASTFDENNLTASYSFAGSIVGALSGTGTIYNCVTDTTISVLASKAGLMFGVVDAGATVSGATLENQADNIVNGFTYAGLVVGEAKGTFENVQIIGTGSSYSNFGQSIYTPTAIGGFAGLMSGGTVTSLSSDQSIVASTSSSEDMIGYVGGLIGQISAQVTLTDVTLGSSSNAVSLVGYQYVGGVVGCVDASGTVYASDISVYADLQAIGIKQTYMGVGGFAGCVGSSTLVSLSSTSSTTINTFDITATMTTAIYGEASISIGAGAVIGYNASTELHSVTNTTSALTLSCDVKVQSVSSSSGSRTATMTAANSALAYTLDGSTTSASETTFTECINPKTYTATNSKYSCSVTYTINTLSSSNRSFPLQLNLYGSLA